MKDLYRLYQAIKLRIETLTSSGKLSDQKAKSILDHLEAAVEIRNGEELLTIIKLTDEQLING